MRVRWRSVPMFLAAAVVGCGGAVTASKPATAAHRFVLETSRPSPPVQVGEPVRVDGVSVGRVTSRHANRIEFALGMESSENAPGFVPVVKSDARVRIRRRLFVNDAYYLDLHPGSRDAPPLAERGIVRGG